MSRLLNVEQTADYLCTTPKHVLRLWERREIAAVKVGKLLRFDPADLEEYIESQKVRAVR